MRINDFYFGLKSLLGVVQGFQLTRMEFTKQLWFCLSQYGEISNPKHLRQTVVQALPGLSQLTALTIPHIATVTTEINQTKLFFPDFQRILPFPLLTAEEIQNGYKSPS